ncbi:MAG: galactokinase [Candidatus Aminicenantes bacterium]|nr:galactokinase [Candidatus Aminicenantes bacterium]
MTENAERIGEAYRRLFGDEPLLVRSPGRVNLIGEHTDYNGGFVLPAAVDKAVYFALGRAAEGDCYLQAEDLRSSFVFHPERIEKTDLGWPNYLTGVVLEIRKTGRGVPGFRCVFGGNIPIGAGLSSSAALEAGLAFGLNRLFGLGLEALEIVKLAQRAENEFVGVRCGIMDQFVNIFARPRAVLKLDCRSLTHTHHPFERDDLRIVLCDTKVRRALASSEYNVRRAQCEEGVTVLQRRHSGVRSLRDATIEMLEACRRDMDPVVHRRCAYVVKENARVEAAGRDLEKGDFLSFGRRMDASHDGLRDEYEVSCRELDILVEAARRAPGVLGARMMGAGFGGCTINLVEERAVEEFRAKVGEDYRSRAGREPEFHVVRLSAGTGVLTC